MIEEPKYDIDKLKKLEVVKPKQTLDSIGLKHLVLPDEFKGVEDVVRRLLDNCRIKNDKHLLRCDCLKEHYEFFRVNVFNTSVDKVKDEGLSVGEANDVLNYTFVKRMSTSLLMEEVKSNSVVCLPEVKFVLDILSVFVGRYDLSDPNVFLVVNNVVMDSISAFRLGQVNNEEDVTFSFNDRFGNRRLDVSPVIEARRRLGESVTSAVKTLNDIVYGSKSLNLNVEAGSGVFSLKDFMSSIRSVDDDDVKEIED